MLAVAAAGIWSAAAHQGAAAPGIPAMAASTVTTARHSATFGPVKPAATTRQALPVTAATNPPVRLDAVLAAATISKIHLASGGTISGRPVPTPRQTAIRLLKRFGWSRRQFRYLDPLWERESSWNVRAYNPYTGAYGIPQAEPGDKMASAGRNWRTSARTQILWGLRYIKGRYGSPKAAWQHELSTGWY